jgi:membrane fusion protein (multidrug efflux system)
MRALTLGLLGSLLLLAASCSKDEEQSKPLPPPNVIVFETKAQRVPIHGEFVGEVLGYKDIAIRARVEGYLEGIHFEEGSRVEQGALLYTLESQPFEAAVAAEMSKVAEAKTAFAKAESDLKRIRPLAEAKAVSESDLDSAVALYEASIAGVEAAEANLRAANIQLSYTKIHSPISGIIGRTKAKVGDFVGREPNPVILNVVSRIDTVLVQFFITENQYLRAARRHGSRRDPVEETLDEEDLDEEDLELILADGSVYDHKGAFDFADRGVDPTTGAMLVQASFPNPDELLRPGQFAKVKAEVAVVEEGILIPQRCVTELQGTHSVYVIDESNIAQRREVKAGPKFLDSWLILEGLEPGERVVYEGLQKVRDGTSVNPTVRDTETTIQESS